MSDILVSPKLSEALLEIEKQIPTGLNTVENKFVAESVRAVIREGSDTLKQSMEAVGAELNVNKYRLHLKMGRYIMHGRWKPHIWGAFIPSNVKAPSKITPQLYAFRSSKILGWGFCPSDKAIANVLFMNVFRKVLSENVAELETLFKKGFIGRGYDDNQTHSTVEAFLKSDNLTLARVFFAPELPKESEVMSMMAEDMKALLPLYNKIVNTVTVQNMLGSVDKNDDGDSEDEIEIGSSLYDGWNKWFNSRNDVATREVPPYLQSEIGTKWQSLNQLWTIGNREAQAAVKEALAGKVNEDRLQALLFGNLRRTAFTGGWRNAVKEHFADTLKCINAFVQKYPNGCTNEQFDGLVADVKKITNFNLESFISRFLCDLAPNFYLPLGNFTVRALQSASREMGVSFASELSEKDYESLCDSAQQLAKHLPNVDSKAQVYVFDHFLYWLELQQNGKLAPVDSGQSANTAPISDGRRFWKISSGRSGKYVSVHKSSGVISIGWGRSGDVHKYKSFESLSETFKKLIDIDFDAGHAARQVWLFANDIKKNDYIFSYGSETVLMVGIDKGNYDFKDVNSWAGDSSVVGETHKHIRQIEWLNSNPVETARLNPDLKRKLGRNQTIIELTEAEANEILELAGVGEDTFADEQVEEAKTLSLSDLCDQTSKTSEFFETLKRRLEAKKQVVFFGPPGTSKTHAAKLFASWFTNGEGLIKSVQFHPSYCYEDFIEGFRPANDKSGRQFHLEPGVFKEFCKHALRNRDQKHVFIIDEINRGNLPQIFGELLYLLEYRDEEATLPYSKSPFSIPDNVYIVATMNSADRSIAMVDYALRRRFEFFDFPPDVNVLKDYLEKNSANVDEQKIVELFEKLNSVVGQELGKHYKVGHTYFMKPNLDEHTLRELWQFSVMPLLEEYFFDNEQALELLMFDSLWGKKAEAA